MAETCPTCGCGGFGGSGPSSTGTSATAVLADYGRIGGVPILRWNMDITPGPSPHGTGSIVTRTQLPNRKRVPFRAVMPNGVDLVCQVATGPSWPDGDTWQTQISTRTILRFETGS